VKIRGKSLCIAGIQNRMAAGQELLGRVHFTSTKCFDEIIDEYSDRLAPLLPNHLRSFSYLKSECFNLNTVPWKEQNIQHVKTFLRTRADQIIQSRHTPNGIKALFKDRFLLHSKGTNDKAHLLYSKTIWIIWLEFLAILNLVKEMNFSDEELTDTINSIRLIYSDTDADWSEELNNLIFADYKGLRKNGTVIVGVKSPPVDDDTYIIGSAQIPLINTAFNKERDGELLQIDKGIKHPFEDFKFIHIEYFKKKAIVLKHTEWAAINTDEGLLEKLKEEYKILIS
jgi:hypothetical protein